MIIFFLTLFVISLIFLIPSILLQTNGADNGVFTSNITAGAFGAKSNELLVKFTSWMVAIFIGSALLLSIQFVRSTSIDTTPAQAQETQETQPIEE